MTKVQIKFLARLVKKGQITIDEVKEDAREDVLKMVEELKNEDETEE